MEVSPDDVQTTLEGVFALLALGGVIPAAVAAPFIMIGRGLAGIFGKRR